MNEVLKAIAGRRSIRQFQEKQITDDELQAILEAGLQAPSGHNDQPWYFLVIQDRAMIDEISEGSKREMRKSPADWIANLGKNEKFRIFYNAPTVIVVAARKDAISPLADVCAAVQNMLIAAESLGMGSCWIGFVKFYFTGPESYVKTGIPEGFEVYYAVALGYKPEGLMLNARPRKYERYFHIVK